MALLAMAWFHHVERKRNFLVAHRPPRQQIASIKQFLGRRVATQPLRHLGIELLVVCTSLYVVATLLHFLGANLPTIVAGIGIGIVFIAIEKHRTPRNQTLAKSRFQ